MGGNRHVTLDETKGINLFINRGSNYASKCGTGFRGHYYNAHHVVPCTSIQKSTRKFLESKKDEAPTYNKALARFTHWNVNDGANLIGLPHKNAYEIHYGTLTTNQLSVKPQWMMSPIFGPAVAPHLPIHLPTSWGHVDYNEDVEIALDRIWCRLNVELSKHEEGEPDKANDLGGDIQTVSDVFRGKLSAKTAQTQAAWVAVPRNQAPFMMV